MGTRLPRASQSAGPICVCVGEGRRDGAEQREDITFFCLLQRQGVWGYERALLTQHTFRGAVSMFSAFLMASVVDVSAGLASSSLVLGGDNEEDKPR